MFTSMILPAMRVFRKYVNAWNPGCKTYFNFRKLSTSRTSNIKVAVCGSNGGVGQPLCLLLRMSPVVREIALYDINNPEGELADLSHIDTNSKLRAYSNVNSLSVAFDHANIIVISAGKARAPGMCRADLLNFNTKVIVDIVKVMATAAPKAMLCIVTNPVNSLTAIAAEILKENDAFSPHRLFGVTTLDTVRASAFVADALDMKASKLKIPVVGGHSGSTIVPIFSQSNVKLDITTTKRKLLIERIQNGGTEVLKAKKGAGSATLSTAYAVSRFVNSLCRGIKGESNVVECAMVQSEVTKAPFFSNPVLLGCQGMEKNLGLGDITDEERALVEVSVAELVKEISDGIQLVKNEEEDSCN